jgi:hypothetical protein
MMSSAGKQGYDDQTLIQYLLGTLSEEETERLDELSIADDAFAWRLSAVENDLVDAYVRGELSAEDLAQFKKSYLSSPKRLHKVEFAGALSSLDAKAVTASAQAKLRSKPEEQSSRGPSLSRWFSVPHLVFQRGFAVAALLILLMASYLVFENARLRKQTIEEQRSHAAFDQREQELQQQLNEQRAANAQMAREVDSLRGSQPNLDQLNTLAALLLPPTRGGGQLPTVSVPPGRNVVVLLLALESDDFPAYRVGLKEVVTNQTVWHSANLQAGPSRGSKAVVVTFPARLLKQQNYVLELSGVASNGRAEFISGYPFQVTLK